MSKSFFVADDKRVSFTAEEVSSPRQPEESQEEVEGTIKSIHICYSCPVYPVSCKNSIYFPNTFGNGDLLVYC